MHIIFKNNLFQFYNFLLTLIFYESFTCYLLTPINILLINFSFISQFRITNISSIVQTDSRQII